MTSVVSSRQGRVYVAGAPRFNHTGKIILFTMHNNRSLTIHQALRGEQVRVHGSPLAGRTVPRPQVPSLRAASTVHSAAGGVLVQHSLLP